MKRLLLLFLLISSYCFSQSSGITYQAVIYNPNGEELPGVDNPYAPLVNKSICLQFGIVDADGTIEYQEQTQVTTDAFGMVNLLIGTSTQTGGFAQGFTGIEWSADAKFLKVDLDTRGNCVSFEELSNQPFTYVPFAYYSPASDIPGPQGEQGEQGPQGEQGTTGATGPQGEQGTTGATGPQGAQGEVGPQGEQGTTGATGPQGAQGETGPQGQDGAVGATGPQGEQGETGPQGQNGQDGPPGQDGAEGATGEQGEQGPQGNPGENGEDGTQGTQGDPGPPGPTGATGPQGQTGPQGEQGIAGEIGIITLINTDDEVPGTNCENGGVKIEVGQDTNDNGILDPTEVDDTLTRYICDGNEGQDGTSIVVDASGYYTGLEDLETISPVGSCTTLGDPEGYITPVGSGWTTAQAIGYTSCVTSPNGIYQNTCGGALTTTLPEVCTITINNPLPTEVVHLYENLNSAKIEITPPIGMECFETIMKVEFIDTDGQLIPSFVEHQYVKESVGYPQSDYFSSNPIQELNLNTINPRLNGLNDYLSNKLIFNLPNIASNLKITFIANAPTEFTGYSGAWPCTENAYLTVFPAYYSGIPRQPSLIWIHRDLIYEVLKWQ